MEKHEAIQIIEQLAQTVKATLQEHQVIHQAINVLKMEDVAKKVEDKDGDSDKRSKTKTE